MLLTDEKMFPNDQNAFNRNVIFMAGFHLGIPLAAYNAREANDWKKIKDEIAQRFAKTAEFQIVTMDYHPETIFPLGKPLSLTYADFFEVCDLQKYLQDNGVPLPTLKYKFDHLIWICPSGVVLLMVQISLEPQTMLSLNLLESIVETHYAELTFVFNEVADIVYQNFPAERTSRVLASVEDIERCKNAIRFNRETVPANAIDRHTRLHLFGNTIDKNPVMHQLYEDILIDVYFVDYTADEANANFSISYTDTTLAFADRSYLPILGIGASTFVAFLWIQKHLHRRVRELQGRIGSVAKLGDESYAQLKLLRMFVLSLINESSPMNVRLKAQYMKRLTEFWKAEEMNGLVDQIKSQLSTMEEMFKWIEDSKSATRTLKFTLGGLVFALLSAIGGISGLVSAFATNTPVAVETRLALIVIGLIIVSFIYFLIWKLPSPFRK